MDRYRRHGKRRQRVNVRLPPDTRSPRKARDAVGLLLADVDQRVLQAAELCVDELVSNVNDHAHTSCDVLIDVRAGEVRIAVHDRCPDVPVPGHPDLNDLSGRGLLLVAAFADRWGYELDEDAGGKTVWCELGAR